MQMQIVAIDKQLQHKKYKTCFGWKAEPTDQEKDDAILGRYPGYMFAYKAVDDHQASICDVCLWFNEPYCSPSSIVYDKITIHSTTSSLYNITNMIKGEVNKLYNQEYGPILTITEQNYKDMYTTIYNLQPPASQQDKDLYNNSLDALRFINKWLNHDNIDILCISDIT